MVLAAKEAVTPAGSPVATPIPVAPVVVWVIGAGRALLIQTVGVEDAAETVLSGVTVINPDLLTVPQPPVNSMLKAKLPETVGVPLMVTVLAFQVPLTPAGSPVISASVAPAVV